MRILLINYEFPPIGGGAANAAFYLSKGLTKKHSVFVLTSHFGDLPFYEKRKDLQILRLKVNRKRLDRSTLLQLFLFAFKGILASKKIKSRFRPDISLAFFTIPSGIIALWLQKIYHIPYLVSLRGADVPGFFGAKRMRLVYQLTNPLTKLIWRRAKKVVANSSGLQKLASKTMLDLKIDIIPNGVDTDYFKAEDGRRKTVRQLRRVSDSVGENRILFVGRLDEQKGLKYLIQAINRLKNKNYELRIVGDGLEFKNLKSQISNLKIEDKVIFAGWKKGEELKKEYQKADIFVLPSLSEGMANCLLEAMASGLPVVATKIAGNEELVKDGENGFLVPPRDSSALARALLRLINEPRLRQKFACQSREIALRYSWRKTTRKYLDLISKND